MLFSVQTDTGGAIVGYFVPDGLQGRAELVAASAGRELARVAADEPRPAILEAGRHETGLCGFTFDEGNVPGLSEIEEVEILDVQSGVVVYRRCPPGAVLERKLFRLETNLLPSAKLDRAVRPAFRFHYPSIDRHGLETVKQIFMLNNQGSIYVSGRVAFRSLEHYLDQGYGTVTLVQDPFDELAERILVLRLLAQGFSSFLGPRDTVLMEAAAAFAAELAVDGSDKDLKRAFRTIPTASADILSNPLARQLTTKLPGEGIGASAVSSGLTALASFELVGLRDRPAAFLDALADLLSMTAEQFPSIEPIAAVKQLSGRLRACAPAELLLEQDLVLYEQVRNAFKKSGIEP